jgi:Caspase domain
MTEPASPPVAKPFPRQRAILIGADQYQHFQELKYSGKDVRDMARLFRESLDFDKTDVLEFTGDAELKPQRSTILHHVKEFLKRDIKPDELLLFYFSGHGMIDSESREDYLLPVDATPNELSDTGISVTHVTKRLIETGCRNIVMFVDACRENLDGAKGTISIGEASKKALERDGIVTFFSCDPRERSYEIGELEHGSFTHCLMNAIQEGEYSTVEAIDRYLRDNVPLVNEKYKKPLQRPFTIIQPAEKAQLAIFYSEMKRGMVVDRFLAFQDQLGDIMARGDDLDARSFTDAIEFLERLRAPCVLNSEDKRRLAFIEKVCSSIFTPRAFHVAWKAMRRSAKALPKSLN